MEIEQVDSYNLMAIAVLEFSGNYKPSEEDISLIEDLLKRNSPQLYAPASRTRQCARAVGI